MKEDAQRNNILNRLPDRAPKAHGKPCSSFSRGLEKKNCYIHLYGKENSTNEDY